MADFRVKILSFIIAATVAMGFSLVHAQGQTGNPASPPDTSMSGPPGGMPPNGGMPGDAGGSGGPPGGADGGGPMGLSSMPDEVENLMTAAILSDGETVTTEKNKISPSAAVDIPGKTAKNATINAPDSHESGLIVRNGGSFTLKNSAIEKSSGPLTYQVGKSDEGDGKSFLAGGMFGINSAVLAYGVGSTATLENVDIKIASPEDPEQVHGSNGVFANMHGEIFLKNVDSTSGPGEATARTPPTTAFSISTMSISIQREEVPRR